MFAILCLQEHGFIQKPSIEEINDIFINEYNIPPELSERWFTNSSEKFDISFDTKEIDLRHRKLAVANSLDLPEIGSISFEDKASVAKKAGEWNSSAYLQKLNPNSSAKSYIFIPDTDFQKKLVDGFSSVKAKERNKIPTDYMLNKIYFGPAGTGKSYRAREELSNIGVENENLYEITFHPEYSYHDFFGSLKPAKLLIKSEKTEIYKNIYDADPIHSGFMPIITYNFEAGPFLQALKVALCNKDLLVGILIDELNRGNVPEIMGDLFQLLDRESGYGSNTNTEALNFLKQSPELNDIKKLILPNNLIIRATINPADQNVFMLDTAFKRRWDWEYTPVNYEDNNCINWTILFGEKEFNWLRFIKIINNHLVFKLELSEDKQIGQYFINGSTKPKPSDTVKILKYVWEDIPKHKRYELFSQEIKSFSQILNKIESKEAIEIFVEQLATDLFSE
jgi:hypothetical protein